MTPGPVVILLDKTHERRGRRAQERAPHRNVADHRAGFGVQKVERLLGGLPRVLVQEATQARAADHLAHRLTSLLAGQWSPQPEAPMRSCQVVVVHVLVQNARARRVGISADLRLATPSAAVAALSATPASEIARSCRDRPHRRIAMARCARPAYQLPPPPPPPPPPEKPPENPLVVLLEKPRSVPPAVPLDPPPELGGDAESVDPTLELKSWRDCEIASGCQPPLPYQSVSED